MRNLFSPPRPATGRLVAAFSGLPRASDGVGGRTCEAMAPNLLGCGSAAGLGIGSTQPRRGRSRRRRGAVALLINLRRGRLARGLLAHQIDTTDTN
eukprot:SAG31_NODE_531_length_14413_cov_7.712659_14_plen_96_part_00